MSLQSAMLYVITFFCITCLVFYLFYAWAVNIVQASRDRSYSRLTSIPSDTGVIQPRTEEELSPIDQEVLRSFDKGVNYGC